MQLTSRDLNAALWAAADEMRKVMSADVYVNFSQTGTLGAR